MKRTHLLSTISLFITGLASPLLAQTAAKPVELTPTERVALWPGKAPVGNGKFENCNLELEVFLPPADKATGTAIVLCPGGGPKDAYYMAGAGGQYTIIIPSHDLVVVRMGHYKGSNVGFEALCNSLAMLRQTIPEHGGK